MKFRNATPADAEAIFAIENLVQSNPWALNGIQTEIERAHSVVAVRDNGQLEGYVFFRGNDVQYDLTNIAVAPSNYGNGLAKKLMDQMITAITSTQLGKVSEVNVLLEVSGQNLRAIRFYEKSAFKPLSIRPRYYRDGSDAVVMTMRIARN